jgi:hypothetical protein
MNTVASIVPVIVGGIVTIIAAVGQMIVTVKHSNNVTAVAQAQAQAISPKAPNEVSQ